MPARQRATLVPIALAGVLALAACGIAGATTPPPASPPGSAAPVDAEALRACLAQCGVVLPEPAAAAGLPGGSAAGTGGGAPPSGGPDAGPVPAGVDAATWAAAQAACDHLLPAGRSVSERSSR